MANQDITTILSTKATTAQNWAYVTFLAGNGDCVQGVVGLAKGLKMVKSQYPLVVAVLPDVAADHRQSLVTQGCIVKEIKTIYPPENQTQFAMASYAIDYSKLGIWEFVEHSKMIYLGKYTQVFGNIDHLFEYPESHLYAPLVCFCDEEALNHGPQYNGYCQQCPEKVQWDSELGLSPPPLYFSADMFVYKPNTATYGGLINTLKNSSPCSFQDLFNRYFKDEFLPLPYNYSCNLSMLSHHPEIELDKVKVVHYRANESKPWRYIGKQQQQVKELVEKWWQIYNDESLNYENYSNSLESDDEGVNLEPFISPMSEATDLNGVSAPPAAQGLSGA